MPSSGPVGAAAGAALPIPCGFPLVNPLAPYFLPPLFSGEADG